MARCRLGLVGPTVRVGGRCGGTGAAAMQGPGPCIGGRALTCQCTVASRAGSQLWPARPRSHDGRGGPEAFGSEMTQVLNFFFETWVLIELLKSWALY